jgi:hypothetical protein
MSPIDLVLLSQILAGVAIIFVIGFGISHFQSKLGK